MKFNLNTLSKLYFGVAASTLGALMVQGTSSAQDTTSVPVVSGAATGPEIILYDAETIARINGKAKVQANARVDTVTPRDPALANRPGTDAPAVEKDGDAKPAAAVKSSGTLTNPATSPEKTRSIYPRDISDQVAEIIAGVPIIENPEKCDNDELDIDVTVQDVASSKGMIVADLHNDVEEDFLVWDKVILRVRMPARKGTTKFCMPLTQPGDYAVAIYHDKNGNKEFDKNFLGLPKEHFGMSRDPKFGTKSPKLEEAIFTVPETGKKIVINLFSTSDIMGGRKKK